jgi:glycyl-tRNA synthetase
VVSDESVAYLRPETAQGMFTNFKNVVDSFYPDLPFGLAQIGRSFRNEISPGNFIFRLRELEIMELEYFVRAEQWRQIFDDWLRLQHEWFDNLGLDATRIKEHEVPEADRAHYSERTVDCFYDFPSLGFQEIAGLAYRTDFDLKNHQQTSGRNLEYRPKDGGEPFIPHVIEPTFGLDRHVMAVLSNAYTVDEVNGEQRIFLKLPAHLAPVKVAVSPLLKNKPELVAKAREIYMSLKKEFGAVMWDDNGNIGKRYRRQDEIGTPHCVVIDFETLEGDTKDTVTVRDRDTTEQRRVAVSELSSLLKTE